MFGPRQPDDTEDNIQVLHDSNLKPTDNNSLDEEVKDLALADICRPESFDVLDAVKQVSKESTGLGSAGVRDAQNYNSLIQASTFDE